MNKQREIGLGFIILSILMLLVLFFYPSLFFVDGDWATILIEGFIKTLVYIVISVIFAGLGIKFISK